MRSVCFCRIPKGVLPSVKACCFSVNYCHTTSLKLILSRTICAADMIPQIKQLVKKRCDITFLSDHTCDFHYWWADISVNIWHYFYYRHRPISFSVWLRTFISTAPECQSSYRTQHSSFGSTNYIHRETCF